MSRREDQTRLRHILDHAREAVAMAVARTRADLDSDRQLNLSLVRLVEVVGEAATKLSDEFKAARSEVPWQQIVGMRNRLIHGYDSVDFDILWDVVRLDLPELIDLLSRSDAR